MNLAELRELLDDLKYRDRQGGNIGVLLDAVPKLLEIAEAVREEERLLRMVQAADVFERPPLSWDECMESQAARIKLRAIGAELLEGE